MLVLLLMFYWCWYWCSFSCYARVVGGIVGVGHAASVIGVVVLMFCCCHFFSYLAVVTYSFGCSCYSFANIIPIVGTPHFLLVFLPSSIFFIYILFLQAYLSSLWCSLSNVIQTCIISLCCPLLSFLCFFQACLSSLPFVVLFLWVFVHAYLSSSLCWHVLLSFFFSKSHQFITIIQIYIYIYI